SRCGDGGGPTCRPGTRRCRISATWCPPRARPPRTALRPPRSGRRVDGSTDRSAPTRATVSAAQKNLTDEARRFMPPRSAQRFRSQYFESPLRSLSAWYLAMQFEYISADEILLSNPYSDRSGKV